MKLGRDRLYAGWGVVLVLTSVLATIPVLGMGVNDDWSYAWIALRLARSGEFVDNGWTNAMLGVQAGIAATLIRVFGFSFTMLRLTTLPFAAGCVLLLYRLGRATGLNSAYALFGALTVTLSPVFTPLAASFMTDIPAFFFWLASAYCALVAVQNPSSRRACAWMIEAVLTGACGGTIRQVVWFVPLLALPAIAWLRRRERPIVVCAAALWIASAGVLLGSIWWFQSQAHPVVPLQAEARNPMEVARDTVESLVEITVAGLLLLLPLLAGYLARWREFVRARWAFATGAIGAAVLAALLALFGDELFLGNIVTARGIIGLLDLPGTKPEIVAAPVRLLLRMVMVVTTGAVAAIYRLRTYGPILPRAEQMRRWIWIAGPPTLLYALAILYRSVSDWLLFDRYVILLLPLAIIPLAGILQEHVRNRPPAAAWIFLALFAFFGVATTHDYLASARARLRAATTVRSSGVPRTKISAGLEYDAWTQLEQTGRIHAQAEATNQDRYPTSPPYWFWAKTPSVHPVYVVTHSPLPGLKASRFPPVTYRAWLPPFRRQVLIQQVEE